MKCSPGCPTTSLGLLFRIALIFLLLSGLPLPAQEDATEGPDGQLRRDGRPTLLLFTGSDWCHSCMRFERRVLSQPTVEGFLRERVNIVQADFPQRTQLDAGTLRRNEALAEQYNPNGEFPRALLLNPDLTVRAMLSTNVSDGEEFIAQVSRHLPAKPSEYTRVETLMGSTFDFTIVHTGSQEARRLLDTAVAEVKRVEHVISSWDPGSEVSDVNRGAGVDTVSISPELYSLIDRSLSISSVTQGAFDITIGALVNLWRFDGTMSTPPSKLRTAQLLKGTGKSSIALIGDDRVFLRDSTTRLTFGAIGKGYAADRAVSLLQDLGVSSGVVNAAGDLRAWGAAPDGVDWRVGVSDPEDRESILFWMPAEGRAVATSGDYVKYVEFDGVRYSHIIDPRTGWPTSSVTSATVVSASAELSDALATALSVLGPDIGIDMIEQIAGVDAVLIDSEGRVHISSGLKYLATSRDSGNDGQSNEALKRQ